MIGAAGADRNVDATIRTTERSVFFPRTLGTRLALTYSGLVLLIMAVLGWSLAGAVRDFYIDQLRADLMQETTVAGDLLAPILGDEPDAAAVDAVAGHLGEALDVRVTVIGADGTVYGDSERDPATMENHGGRPEVQAALRTGSGSSTRLSSTLDEPFFYVAKRLEPSNSVVRLGIPLDQINALVRDVQQRIAIAALVAAALMTGAGWFVARRIGSALEAIQEQAALVASGQLDAAVEPAPTQELGDLGRSFNAMTEQLRETLSELERVRARLEATLANLSDGVIITDARGHIVLANAGATGMLAFHGPAIGEPFVQVARDHELTDLIAGVLTGTGGVAEKVIRHGRSGKLLQAAATRLDAANERIGLVVLRDITELRRLEAVRRDFVANVSHELRTPLTSIRALVETLEAGAIDDPEVATDFMARIIAEVDRLAQLVDELLDLARLEAGRAQLSLERVGPEDLVKRALERMAPQSERAKLTTEFVVEPGTPAIMADRSRIDQVLLNLVHNAIKFTPSGGEVTVFAARAGDFVEFRVRDTGLGVSPDDMPRLFERFYKVDKARRSHGTGLGLAIAKHIVQSHGGAIWAEPNPGRGTVFVFTLPIEGPAKTDEASANPRGASTEERVLT